MLRVLHNGILFLYIVSSPLLDIVATVFNSSSQRLLITVHFTVQLLLADSHTALFQLSHLWNRDIYPCQLCFMPFSGRLYCILAIEMPFQNLALHAQISDIQCPTASYHLTIQPLILLSLSMIMIPCNIRTALPDKCNFLKVLAT